ncbi:MAG: SUMF1/EgtB/PvdO family nonheme iron enzyme [Lentimicrobiaceae bacterium]|nr:SUMF1/EgtB/PvdO family nonheme iron enzyme [Lentimicrobiaceae bacterium]
MIRQRKIISLVCIAALLVAFSGCSKDGISKIGKKETSNTTGWAYNDPKWGGFEVAEEIQQITGPGLVYIEGGSFVMGATQQDVLYDWDNIPRRVTVNSFYMDETEVANVDYLEYLYWLGRVFGADYPEALRKALPDTLVWRDRLAFNEPFVTTYLRHPSYKNYPVVGVSWVQANDYCVWRTDRVNEMLLIKKGILQPDPDQRNENNFNTETYLAGQYQGLVNKNLPDLSPNGNPDGRPVRFEDGILLPEYRLPTEAEWEYAAYGLIGNTMNERIVERKTYPWNGTYVRTDEKKYYGNFIANFKRGRGDYMGVAGNLNDGALIPTEVSSYWPNDFGLYNMAGNVAEWVLDVYRPLTYQDVADLQPFRGNVFTVKQTDEDGFLAPKDSLGRLKYREVTPEEAAGRKNYRKADNINYKDGDYSSTIASDWMTEPAATNTTQLMYDYGNTSLISDKSRVYKGGSWRDPAYYLSPSVRRYLDEEQSANHIGFRCAMTRMGSSYRGN